MISYAQNLEDVVLNRLFQNKPTGFYIDVGAHDPTEFSVTKHFYDLGWRGINIEPILESFEKFKQERPRDINLNLAIGARHDFISIYEVTGRPDLSTLTREIAVSAGRMIGTEVRPLPTEVRTLAEVCEKYCDELIDFIKIDVEGGERNAILGADWEKFRPTMLAIEATAPCKAVVSDWKDPDKNATWNEWESLLFEVDYIFVYYDGLNRYYLRKEDEHLKNRFHIPITPLQDNFSLHKDLCVAWETQKQLGSLEDEKAKLQKEKLTSEEKVQKLGSIASDQEEQIANLVEKSSQLYGRLNGLETEKKDLDQKLINTLSRSKQLEAQLTKANKVNDGLRETSDGLKLELESTVSDQEERIVKLVEESSRLYGRLNELEAEKKDLGQKLGNAQTRSKQLEAQLSETNKVNGGLRETSDGLKLKLGNAQTRSKQLEAQLSETNKVNGGLRETSDGLKLKLGNAQTRSKQIEAQLSETNKVNSDLLKIREQLTSEVVEQRRLVEVLKAVMEEERR